MMTQGMRDDLRMVEDDARRLLVADFTGMSLEEEAVMLEGMAVRIAGVMAELAKECAK